MEKPQRINCKNLQMHNKTLNYHPVDKVKSIRCQDFYQVIFKDFLNSFFQLFYGIHGVCVNAGVHKWHWSALFILRPHPGTLFLSIDGGVGAGVSEVDETVRDDAEENLEEPSDQPEEGSQDEAGPYSAPQPESSL